ncbi:kinase binding protein CGI-121-domain-containing protein [Kockovaella imperatae]|uniref:EKC/KEOPS complex subunit CGI121 n=1 Tax=Kockovaella imperatae TaxID=4999 RepID=A0A1Y1UB21_9TREE|nr:kinase binding protein CGI-121-domain-containing protein [Kockovaella imperatae]ORX35219.1 kinase binding protein CGI-121-domain-containing protein [Kockovaella imperatae]
METYRLSNFPPGYSTVHIALFRNVVNAPDIRKKLILASTMGGDDGERARQAVDFGFIEARLLVSRMHLLIGIMTTLQTCLQPSNPSISSSKDTTTPTPESTNATPVPNENARLSTRPITRTHNLHSEILLTLSSNNNISESLRRHGMSDTTDELVVVRIADADSSEEAVWKEMELLVDGQLVNLGELDSDELVDWPRVSKIFKLSELDRLPLTPLEIRDTKIATVINTVAIKHVT